MFVALVIQHGRACTVLNCIGYNSFPHYLTNSMIFGKKLLDIKCILILSTTVVWIISHHSKSNSARYYHKRTHVAMSSARYFCKILMKLWFSQQIFEKSSNINYNKNSSIGSRVVPYGRADMTKLIVVFHNVSHALKTRGAVHSFNFLPVLQVHSLFQSEFPTECDLVLPLSISSIPSLP